MVSRLLVSQCIDRLVACLLPCPQSETRRYAIASHVVDCIKRCFQGGSQPMAHRRVEAFPFGSVPLKAYLPDGDVDISIFVEGLTEQGTKKFKEQWAYDLKSFLEAEMEAGQAEAGSGKAGKGPGHGHGRQFQIQEVQAIQAEVKIVKCIVSGLEVDVSCNALGGLCTVGFLEWCDDRIGKDHLLKKSILLIKAWCYYESRLLGAHHGMLSSYALEVMVLYVMNVHGEEMDSPMEVFLRFMQVFADFDWERYCLSVLGPIELEHFPHPRVAAAWTTETTDPTVLDTEELIDAVLRFSTKPTEAAQAIRCLVETTDTIDSSSAGVRMNMKHLNIMDPLMPTNNLGRSVSKTNAVRMRMAFAHGSKSLMHVFMHQEPAVVSQRIALYFNSTWNSIHRVSFDNRSFSTSAGRLNPEYLFMTNSTSQRMVGVGGIGGIGGLGSVNGGHGGSHPAQRRVSSVPESDVADVNEDAARNGNGQPGLNGNGTGKEECPSSSQGGGPVGAPISTPTSAPAPAGVVPDSPNTTTATTNSNKKPTTSANNTSSATHRRSNSVTSTISMGSMNTIGSTVLAMQMFTPGGASRQGDSLASDTQAIMANIEFARKCQDVQEDAWGGMGARSLNDYDDSLSREISTVGALPTFDKHDSAMATTWASIAAQGRGSGLTPRGSCTLSRRDSLSVNPSNSVSPTRSPHNGLERRRSAGTRLREQLQALKSEGVDPQSLVRRLEGVQLSETADGDNGRPGGPGGGPASAGATTNAPTTWSSIAAKKPGESRFLSPES